MTKKQYEAVKTIMGYCVYLPPVCHHGDCVGADRQFQEICDFYHYFTVAHPPLDEKYRAFCNSSRIREPQPYLERNHEIVDESHVMLFTPKGDEIQRSGTWATVRYAKWEKIPSLLVRPDGSVLPS